MNGIVYILLDCQLPFTVLNFARKWRTLKRRARLEGAVFSRDRSTGAGDTHTSFRLERTILNDRWNRWFFFLFN